MWKDRPPSPTRFCLKITLPGESSRMSSATSSSSGDVNSRPATERQMSSARLASRPAREMRASLMPISGMPPMSSKSTRFSDNWNRSGTTRARTPWLSAARTRPMMVR